MVYTVVFYHQFSDLLNDLCSLKKSWYLSIINLSSIIFHRVQIENDTRKYLEMFSLLKSLGNLLVPVWFH